MGLGGLPICLCQAVWRRKAALAKEICFVEQFFFALLGLCVRSGDSLLIYLSVSFSGYSILQLLISVVCA